MESILKWLFSSDLCIGREEKEERNLAKENAAVMDAAEKLSASLPPELHQAWRDYKDQVERFQDLERQNEFERGFLIAIFLMICPKCNMSIDSGTHFCPSCGAALFSAEQASIPSTEWQFTLLKGFSSFFWRRVITVVQKYSDTLQIQQNIKKTFHYGATTKEYTVSVKDIQSVDVRVGFDLAEMLIAIGLAVVGVFFNLAAFILIPFCFWAGYSKKIILRLSNGKHIKIFYSDKTTSQEDLRSFIFQCQQH